MNISICHFQYRNYGAFFRLSTPIESIPYSPHIYICVYVSVAQRRDRCGGGLNAAKCRNQACSLFLIPLYTFYFLQTLSAQCAEHHLGRPIASGHFVIVIITSTKNCISRCRREIVLFGFSFYIRNPLPHDRKLCEIKPKPFRNQMHKRSTQFSTIERVK